MNTGIFVIKTHVGKFKVDKHNNTEFNFLQIGGKNFCVMLRWSYSEPEPEEAELQWLDTYGMKCEMNGIEIRKEKTIHLFQLAITLLKKYAPSIQRLTFIDNSKFPCTLPDGSIEKPSLKHFYFLFHRKTWYEARFNAYPSTDIEKYESIKKNFENPGIKKDFYFMNSDLETILQPIYSQSNTWGEFLEKVSKLPNYCSKVYPWSAQAVSTILEKKAMLPDYWIIDITPEVFPTISFETVVKGGGRRKTKRVWRFSPSAYLPPDTPQLSKMAQLRFL